MIEDDCTMTDADAAALRGTPKCPTIPLKLSAPKPTTMVPCETCLTPVSNDAKRCDNCREVERRLPIYMRSPKGWDFVRQCIPKLDDWMDDKPDAWDYEAVLRDNKAVVEWCDELIDGNGNTHRAGRFAGWGFYWEHGAIHIGRTTEFIARKAAALFVSLWLRSVSASFCDKIMSGMIWFWELQERPRRINTLSPLDLAQLFHETYERLASNFGYQTRPETRSFRPDTPNGRLMIAVAAELLKGISSTC